jgi:hypothetical protein
MTTPTVRHSAAWAGLALVVNLLVGCAAPGSSTIQHSEGATVVIENSVSTAVPFEQAWDKFVAQLSQSFFVINNIEKDSRIINVSFTSDAPEMYVDCGITKREFKFKDEERQYEYQTAASSSYKEAFIWGQYNNLPAMREVNRKALVEGRANIYVAPTDAGTVVSVNAVYVWTVTLSGVATGFSAFGDVVRRDVIPSTVATVRLTTQEPGKADWGDGGVSSCFSTGKFEADVLSLVPR